MGGFGGAPLGQEGVCKEGEGRGQIHLSEAEVIAKGMRTATFQFSESGGSLNGADLFTELPFL